MKKPLQILYLKGPSPEDPQEVLSLRRKYDLRTVAGQADIKFAIEGFFPRVLLCNLNSPVKPEEVLEVLNIPEENSPVILSFVGGDLSNLLPVIETISFQKEEKEISKTNCERRGLYEGCYGSVFRNSIDAILVTRPDGTILAANPAACEMLEMVEEEICQVGRAGIVDPQDHRLEQAISQREKFGRAHTELTFVKKSGKKFPVDLTSSVYEDENGNLITTAIVRDISKRKLVEQELRISNGIYKTIFYHSPIPYWIYDQETLGIVDVNEVALQNYGYTREEFLNLNLMDLRPKSEVPHLNKDLKESFAARDIVRHGKFTHSRKDGSRMSVEIFGYKLEYGNRNCRLIACIDITEKEEAINRLKEKQIRLATAQEIAKIGYWEWDLESKKLFLSDMMYRIWERDKSSSQCTWASFEETIHPQDRAKFARAQEGSIQGMDHNLEYRIITPSGEIKWIHELGQILTSKEGQPKTVERTVQDITEEKAFLKKLTTSESRYKGIVQSQTNYIIRTDMLGNYTYHNDKFSEDFGWLYEDGEIIGQPSLSSIMQYHHQAVIDLVERCVMAPGKPFKIEIDKPRKKGGTRTTLWDFVCLQDAHGSPAEIQCVGIDISGRVKAEKELKNSKLRYKLITKATSDCIWDWDLTSGKLYLGKSFKTMFGHQIKDFQSISTWEKIIHPDDSSRIKYELGLAIEGKKKKWLCEYRLRKKNGDYAYVVEKGSILRDNKKKAYRLVGALQDITEKKKLEGLLEKASKLSRIGSFELDLKTDSLYWSPMTKEIHGVGKDFIPDQQTAINFYKKGNSRNKILNVFARAIDRNEAFDEELEIVTAGGQELWVRVMAQPEVEQGVCVKVNGSLQDIDKVRRAELKVLHAAQEKETLLESIGDAFFAVDKQWTVTYWNTHAAKLLDCPKEAILQKNLWEIFADAVGTPFQRNYEETMKDRKRRHFEAYFERTSRWYDVTVYPTIEGLSVFFKDVTLRKTAEVRLRELNKSLRAHTRELVTANKGLEQFSYIVSHNLRSPVANILGLADLLQSSEYPEEVREKFFAEIFSNVERLDAVITDLNSILQAKVDIKAKKEKVNLDELVDGIKLSIEHLIKEANAEIVCSFDETRSITTVRSYLHSIFYNLMVNSLKYRKPGALPVLEISTVTKGEFVIISFKDNGLGMDLSSKEDQVFSLYKRFHHHIEGKGMGLFMVKTQVEMLGGKISLESEVNKGTTFTIILKENVEIIKEENEAVMSLSGG